MPRTLSAAIQTANAAEDTETHDIMDITLPLAEGESVAPVLHLGTGTVLIGAVEYAPKLRSMFSIAASRGQTPDGGEFTITNLKNDYGPMFLDPARIIDGAEVIIWRAFRRTTLPGGTQAAWNTDQIGQGMLRTRPVSRTEVRAQFIGDMSNPMVQIGGDPLTQRCLKVFNVNGTHPLGASCGWQPAQGGDPLFCDHVFDSANGCAGHNNQFRCGCVPALSAILTETPTITTDPDYSDPNGGFGQGRYPVNPGNVWDPDYHHPFLP